MLGVRLGIDVGKARIGVAQSDRDCLFAHGVETVARAAEDDATQPDIARIVEIAREAEAVELVVGLPLSMSGSQSASTHDAIDFAERLAAAAELPVRLVDERLSTVSAHSELRASGKKTRSHRPVVDQVAAVILLQHALDAVRAGTTVGSLVKGAAESEES